MQLRVDPIARQFCCCIRARQKKRVAGDIAKMFHDGGRADLMRGLSRARADFQYLPKRAQRLAGYLGRVIRAGIRHDDDP